MARNLPPFPALRAFEAAARHLSFKRAAEELHVTQSAVSHQIKALEDHLGLSLFRRLNRAISLTEEGQSYLPAVRDALDQLAFATSRMRGRGAQDTLTISLLPHFAIRWLIPRIQSFQSKHPDIELRLTTSVEPVDFRRGDVDAAIRYGHGSWPGLRVDPLFAEDFFPVCSPDLTRGQYGLRAPQSLAYHTLLHNQSHPGEWTAWLAAAAVDDVDAERGPRFDSSGLTLQAAVEGLGVAIGRPPLVNEDLSTGRLVVPFDLRLTSQSRYCFVCPARVGDDRRISAFRGWLLQEAERDTRKWPRSPTTSAR